MDKKTRELFQMAREGSMKMRGRCDCELCKGLQKLDADQVEPKTIKKGV